MPLRTQRPAEGQKYISLRISTKGMRAGLCMKKYGGGAPQNTGACRDSQTPLASLSSGMRTKAPGGEQLAQGHPAARSRTGRTQEPPGFSDWLSTPCCPGCEQLRGCQSLCLPLILLTLLLANPQVCALPECLAPRFLRPRKAVASTIPRRQAASERCQQNHFH